MCDLAFIKVSDVLCWREGVIDIVNKNNPKTTKIIEKELYVREDVMRLVSPEIAQGTRAEILRGYLKDNTKRGK